MGFYCFMESFFLRFSVYLLFGWAGSPLLLRAFTSCSERVLLSVVHRLLIAVASLVTERRL